MSYATFAVVIANYNHSHYLSKTLDTALNQSFSPKEIIVVDDCSTDASVHLIESYAAKFNNIKIFRNKKNMGVIYSANFGLSQVTADYVVFMSADDFVLPGFFEKSMKILERYPQAGLCCSDPAQHFESNNELSENRLFWSNESCYFDAEKLADVIKGWYIAGHTTFAKTLIIKELGGLLPELKWHCDWFLWHIIAARYGICYIPEPLSVIRVHQESYSASGRKNESEQLKVLDAILDLLKSPRYRDVLPFFIRGSLMSHFGSSIVKAVMNNPKYYDAETLLLIQNPLKKWSEEFK